MAITTVQADGISAAAAASFETSPEFYGFDISADGDLVITTTGGGTDDVVDFEAFKQYMFNVKGLVFQINETNGNLEIVID